MAEDNSGSNPKIQPQDGDVKPGINNTLRDGNDSVFLISLGVIVFVGLVIFGYLLFMRSRNLQNVPSPTNEPSVAVTTDVTIRNSYTPIFEASSCDFSIPIQARVSCGYIVVPEDRKGDLTDTIQLAVAIYHSDNESPKPDPYLYIQGGPGALAIDWSAGVYDTVITPLLNDRDFIVFDPRGVGHSRPRLDCDLVKNTYLSDIQGKYPKGQELSYYEGAMITCRNEYYKLDVNIPTYVPESMAMDAVDVIKALGYDQANLYGASYGTWIAQLVMRDHPDAVRSVVLDSVLPLELALQRQDVNGEIDRVFQLLFEECKAQPACSSAYPDLESGYAEILDRLDAQPVGITLSIDANRVLNQQINGDLFRDIVAWVLRDPLTLASIPQFIQHTLDGDYSPLQYAAAIPLITFDSISMGTYVAVNCHDQVFDIPTEGLDETIYNLCNLWGVVPLAPGENEPVISDIPTLIFSGKYDPLTPTTHANQLARHLSNSHVVEIQNQGHTPSLSGVSDCPMKIISDFINNPDSFSIDDCADETSNIEFSVPYNIDDPVALEPFAIDQFHINTLVPKGWRKAEFGFYNRNDLLGDITQIGIQRAAVSEPEWANWLVRNFAGNRGFDRPPVRGKQRSANGFTWTFYETSSQGNPVDIAFAKVGAETLMVLLISYENEHDALYQTVFLPIVESVVSAK